MDSLEYSHFFYLLSLSYFETTVFPSEILLFTILKMI